MRRFLQLAVAAALLALSPSGAALAQQQQKVTINVSSGVPVNCAFYTDQYYLVVPIVAGAVAKTALSLNCNAQRDNIPISIKPTFGALRPDGATDNSKAASYIYSMYYKNNEARVLGIILTQDIVKDAPGSPITRSGTFDINVGGGSFFFTIEVTGVPRPVQAGVYRETFVLTIG